MLLLPLVLVVVMEALMTGLVRLSRDSCDDQCWAGMMGFCTWSQQLMEQKNITTW